MSREIKVVPLGAGQDVGRSCILLSMGGRNIMLDCGMHMGYNDQRRFPDFSYVTGGAKGVTLDEFIDCAIISHFHLDHCGALPYFSEIVGYNGPIYMTHPTKAICPLLLEDYRKIQVEKKGESDFFTSAQIKQCMRKVRAVNLHETVRVDDEISIKAYYAGHVLGAAMFLVRVGQQSVLYTGDYNMTPDRHLGAACVDKCQPDLLITESTYATTVRDSKRCRERDFVRKVHDCIAKGGKVLIPVFAVGRAQELCILLESYWDRMNLKCPIYFSTGMAEKANYYYKLFISWTSEKIKRTFVQRNMFDFKHIKPFNMAFVDNPGPMVVFAAPGMLHSGWSLQIFKHWAPNENNMLIMPGYCVGGTVGYKVLNGMKRIDIDKQIVDVRMQIQYMSFSAHADAKGIVQLIRHCAPKNVLLVHGEKLKMQFLAQKIQQDFNVACFLPENGETVALRTAARVGMDADCAFMQKLLCMCNGNGESQWAPAGRQALLERPGGGAAAAGAKKVRRLCPFVGTLKLANGRLRLGDPAAGLSAALPEHELRFISGLTVTVPLGSCYDSLDVARRNALLRLKANVADQLTDFFRRHQLPNRAVGAAADATSSAAADQSSEQLVLTVSDDVMLTIKDKELKTPDSAGFGAQLLVDVIVSWTLREDFLGTSIFDMLSTSLIHAATGQQLGSTAAN